MSEPQGEPELQTDRGLFRAEYERELGNWLRRRLGYLCLSYTIYQILAVTALTLTSTLVSEPEVPAQSALLSMPRAQVAERRLEEGLPLRPRDEAALEARDAEQRRLERERSAQAVVSTLDAMGHLARDFSEELGLRKAVARAEPGRSQSREVDRWWLEDAGSPTDVVRAEDAPTPRNETAPKAGDVPVDRADAQPEDAAATGGAVQVVGGDDAEDPDARSDVPANIAPAVDEALLQIPWWVWILIFLPTFAVLGWFGLYVRPRLVTRSELVSAATRMILALGFLNFGFECAMLLANPRTPVFPLFSIFFWHLTASLFLPWSWRESLKPIIPLFACWFLLRLGLATSTDAWLGFILSVIGSPFLFAPALILCYVRLRWHQRQFKSGFVGRRFLAMRREFIQAKSVHESLFPKPEDLGWLRFDFGYRPAADIGGDFIHAWTDRNDRFHAALIDVTGHGLASAMTVARIHGEIERLRDEHPDEGPAQMLSRLNRYFQRLLARHSLFATAVFITVDPHTGELRYASAGHPPVFIRSRNGIRELDSTTFLLGAVDDATFGEEEIRVQLVEGDRLILFTDGAYDAKSPNGERLGLDRLREIIRRPSAPASWTRFLMNLVDTFEAGLPEDDLLIAEITLVQRRSLSSITGDDLPVSRREMTGATG
jgi:hypothetical protein